MRRLAPLLIIVTVCCLMAGSATASAAGQLWWGNRSTADVGIARSAMDGSDATPVLAQTATGPVSTLVVDPVAARIYWIKRGSGELWAADLDGSDPSLLLSGVTGLDPGSTQDSLALEPQLKRLYWTQSDVGVVWASTDGTEHGSLYAPADVPGTMFKPRQIVLDRAHNRIWWANYDIDSGGVNPALGYANLDGTGDAHALDLTCISTTGGPTIQPDDAQGLVVDYASGHLYMQTELAYDASGHFMAQAKLDGTECLQITPAFTPGQNSSKGIAMDPDSRRLYNARGYASPTSPLMNYLDLDQPLPAPIANLPIDPSTTAVGARWPVILMPPHTASGAIAVTASGTAPGATLTCDCALVDDQIPLRVYRGAASQSIAWYRDGVLVPGATATTLVASVPGAYKAVLSGTNSVGTAEITSNQVVIAAAATPASPSLDTTVLPQRRAVVAGQRMTIGVRLRNSGTATATKATACVHLSPRLVVVSRGFGTVRGRTVCFSVGDVKPGASVTRTVVVRAASARTARAPLFGVGRADGVPVSRGPVVTVTVTPRRGPVPVTG